MPITIDCDIHRLSQTQFGAVAFDVLRHAFAIHNQMGRFFDESIYQNELLIRLGSRATKEVLVHVRYGDFCKCFWIDLLVDKGAIFEIKTASEFHDQHRNQLIQYLLLTGLHHGKLINFRTNSVRHEFVNSSLTFDDRQKFEIHIDQSDQIGADYQQFQEVLIGCLHEWGTGLDRQLYEEALTHFFGGCNKIDRQIDVIIDGNRLGHHTVKLLNPFTAFKVTSIRSGKKDYEFQLRKLLEHTNLEHVIWANVTLHQAIFQVVSKTCQLKK